MSDNLNERIKNFKKVTTQLIETYQKKNRDYGNSFHESYCEWGVLAAVVRMDDKMRRLKSLLYKQNKVKDEAFEDTLLDLANYAIMTYLEVKGDVMGVSDRLGDKQPEEPIDSVDATLF